MKSCSNCLISLPEDTKSEPGRPLGLKILCLECLRAYEQNNMSELGSRAHDGWTKYINDFDKKNKIGGKA